MPFRTAGSQLNDKEVKSSVTLEEHGGAEDVNTAHRSAQQCVKPLVV